MPDSRIEIFPGDRPVSKFDLPRGVVRNGSVIQDPAPA